jgi:hypothetical protein
MMQLRSAIAAVNAMDLRDSDSDVTSRDIALTNSPTDPTLAYEATVFGTERNPYITEVMVDTAVPGFIGIELHNPSPIALDLTGWRLGAIDRSAAAVRPRVVSDLLLGADLGTVVAGSLGTATIPPGGYIVLTDGTAADIQADLAARGIIPVPVPGMATLPPAGGFNREIVLLRTRNASGVPSQALARVGDTHDEVSGINLGDLVPVDQIDLTGIQPGAIGGLRLAYRRPSLAAVTPSTAWHFTNAGPYTLTPALGFFRHIGMVARAGEVGNLGAGDTTFGVAATAGTYATRPMQVANTDMGGPNQTYQQLSGPAAATYPVNGGLAHFPFGGFARNGDMLQVTFTGAYTIRAPGDPRDTSVEEMNSQPMDAAFVDDQDATNEPLAADTGLVTEVREQIGRFCPVGNPQAAAGLRGDYEPTPAPTDPNFATIRTAYRYQWAMDLFDHLTVESPSDDFLPNVDPEPADTTMAPTAPAKYPGATGPAPVANAVQTTANDNPGNTPPGTSEGKAPVEGLINLNTASAKVLSALPMVQDLNTGASDTAGNLALAQAIVDWRDGPSNGSADPNGPFRTIYDLYKVPAFYAQQKLVLDNGDPDDVQGDLSPLGTGATGVDRVRYDFEERFLLLNRISNMVTTRSDSYTVYLLVQGWQDAGTANPTLRTQRRLAFIVDRSRITPSSAQLTPIPVPNN